MKKVFLFSLVAVMAMFGFRSNAEEIGPSDAANTAYVTAVIDGQIDAAFKGLMQSEDGTTEQKFAFDAGSYTNLSAAEFDCSLSNTFVMECADAKELYVYLNGVRVPSTIDNGYRAEITFIQGANTIWIYENTPYKGTATITGDFYTFTAQGENDNRDEPFAFTQGTYDNETADFTYSPAVTYELKGQNAANSYFVYVDGKLLPNEAAEGENMYKALIDFTKNVDIQIYEKSPYYGTVTIDGDFYTFVAQNPEDTRDEAFDFTRNLYDNATSEFYFTPGVQYTLKGQNENNSFYVYVNGVQLNNEAGEGETGYVANVVFNVGDVVEIYENTPYVAEVSIDGQFYTFVAQAGDDNRNEAFAFTNDTYDNQSEQFNFSPGVTYTLKGQNEANSFYVYVNGVRILNTVEEGTGYEANVKFVAGDKVEIFENTPYVANVAIDGQFYTFVAQNADNTRDEAFAFTNNTYDNESQEFTFNPGVTYTLKGQNESNSFYVYVNGVQLKNEAGEGETGYVADVKFNVGDEVVIYEHTPYVAEVTIDGQFYTFVAQNPDNTRDEAFAFTNATYENASSEFAFNPGVEYILKGQNEANSFYVYVNGVRVLNTVEEGTGYEANVKFNAGDKVEIFENTPYVANVTIDGSFYTFVAQNADNTRDEAFDFTQNAYDNETREFTFNPGVEYTLKGQNQTNTFFVYVNGVQLNNAAGEGETGYVANVTFQAGDVVEIYESTPYAGTVTIDGQFYTFVAQNADNTRDEAFAFTNDTYDNATSDFTFNPGVTYTLKGQNEANSFFVYVNGVEVRNQAGEGETGFVGDVKFNKGDVVEIFENTPYVGTVKIDGQFYTFVAQAGDDNRTEAFDFTNGTYDNETRAFDFNPGATYTLKGQNEANSFFVYVNGVEVNNEAGEGETGYVANVKFNKGDVVEIYEATPYVANVTIDGQFYTFVAQNADNTRDEAFAFTNNTYDNESSEFNFNPGVTYTLKGQNEANSFYVYVNGVQVNNTVESGYEAEVKFNIGDVVEIYEATPYVANVTIDGQFYTFVAQNPDNTRDEAFAFTYATYDNETRAFNFNPGVTYTLKGQNETDSFFVYVNGVRVNNTVEDGGRYEAEVKFNIGDNVEIYQNTPYEASVIIEGQFYTFVAQNPDNTRDEAFDFTNGTYKERRDFNFNPGVVYTLKGQNEANSFFVYVNGVQLNNEAGEGETGYVANVQFNIGDEVEIYETSPYVANVSVTGQFYTIVAQNEANTRDEAFDFTNGTYNNESRDFYFNPGVEYTIKAQNEANSFYVYVNGELLNNEAGEGETGYVANIKFFIGDEIEIYEATPYVANVTIDGEFYTFVAQNADNTRDEAFAFTYATYDHESESFTFNPGVTYTLKGQNPENIFFVYVNGELIENELDADQTGYEATVTFNIGDEVLISTRDIETGINSISSDYFEGKIFNLQGIEMKNDNLAPGIYIVNGKKAVVK